MKRPDEVEVLQVLGLTQDEARILAGAGVYAEAFKTMACHELWQRLQEHRAWRTVRSITIKKRLLHVRETFTDSDKEIWRGLFDTNKRVADRLIHQKIPFWWVVLEATHEDLLTIPGVAAKTAQQILSVQEELSIEDLFEAYMRDVPDILKHIVISPGIGPRDEHALVEILTANADNLPLYGDEYIWFCGSDDVDDWVWAIRDQCDPRKVNILYIALPQDVSDEIIDTIEAMIDGIYLEVPFSIRTYILRGNILQYLPHRTEGGHFSYSIRSQSGVSLGLIVFDVPPGMDLLDTLYRFPSITLGSGEYTVTDFEVLRGVLYVTRI